MLNALCVAARLFTGVQPRHLDNVNLTEQQVFFANHTSHFDCLILLAVLPEMLRRNIRPVGAADYWTATRFRRFIATKILNVILIERLHPSKTNNPIKPLLEAIDQGYSLLLFPEGSRTSGEVKQFKAGLYHLSKRRPTLALVPTYIENANRILPKGESIPIPMWCAITFGAPIHCDTGESRDEFLSRARQSILRCAG